MEKEFIYLGKHCGYIREDKERNEPNIGVVLGDEQTLLIDAGSSVKHYERVIATLEAAKLNLPTQIVLTHAHWDHCFAGTYYESILYAQSLTAKQLDFMHTWRLDNQNLEQLKTQGDISAWSERMIHDHVSGREHLIVKAADIVFNDQLTFALGAVHAQAIHVGGSHTNDSTLIYVKEDKVLYLGDSLYSSRSVYNRETLWPMIETIKKLDVEQAILSHREPFNREQFQHHLGLFESLHELVGDIDVHIQAHRKFTTIHGRKPTPDEFYILRGLVGGNKKYASEHVMS
ncbi:MAG: MBL fold metallo-hydrolase [Culicoidibacterales bacterium]